MTIHQTTAAPAHAPEHPFSSFLELETKLVASGEKTRLLYATKDAIPGPLQTKAAWHDQVRHALPPGFISDARRDELWAERVERQERLFGASNLYLTFFVGSAVIDRVLGMHPEEIAKGQLDVFVGANRRDNVALRIVPGRVLFSSFYGRYENGAWTDGIWAEDVIQGTRHIDPATQPELARTYTEFAEFLSQEALSPADSKLAVLRLIGAIETDTLKKVRPQLSM